MARSRNIKPAFFTNEDLAEQPYEARLLFAGLWCVADREGRLEDRPKKIKMAIFPGDSVDVERMLQKLHEAKLILRYEVEGARYIQVIKFKKHQSPHFKEPPSTIPEPQALPASKGGGSPGETTDGKKVKPEANPTSKGGGTALIADSGLSDSGLQNPESPIPSKPSAAARRAANGEGRTIEVWNAYSQAYEKRYGVPPVRNRKVNGQLAQVVERLGQEAPAVATFYLGHNKGLYVSSRHCVDLLLRDAEGLRTEWATGRKVTDTEARQADQTAAHGDQAQRMLQKHGARG